MSDLIDRQALKDYVSSLSTHPLNEWDTWGVIAAIDKQPTITVPCWHSVEEPPKGYGAFAACCVYDGKIYWFKAIYLDGKWLREMDGVELPANYWMEIPQPPKEDA